MQRQRPSQLTPRESIRARILKEKHRPGTPPGAASADQRRKRRRISLRAALAVMSGRAAGALSRRLRLGGGTSIVGLVARSLYPDIVPRLASQLEHGSVIVTGTNGKTTTSGFIAAILRDAGLRVWRNREGSNLMSGIAGALVARALPTGNLRGAGRAISIFEVDEAVMPQAAQILAPRVAVFNNLFRDQLDRYGEVESVAALWRQTVKTLPETTTLILNADDPTTASLGELFKGPILYFGVEDHSLDLSAQNGHEGHQTIDVRTCTRCGSDYRYSLRFYSHMGHYHCPNCGQHRPQPAVRAVHIGSDSFDRLRMMVEAGGEQSELVIPLPGLYNVYNALAAVATARALQISWEPIVSGIEQFKPAFGRGERVQVAGRTLRLLLAKNPTGLNEVLRTLCSEGARRHILFVLNDNIADGRDISWIWDVDFERIQGRLASLTVGGSRAFDLALRLKYAGVDPEEMTIVPSTPLRSLKRAASTRSQRAPRRGGRGRSVPATTLAEQVRATAGGEQPQRHGLAAALDTAIAQTPAGDTLFIVPTYTGLLEIHREFERRGLTPHYWEGNE